MPSKLETYNAALLAVGAHHLTSLNENRDERRVLDSIWAPAVAHCLIRGQWNFATRWVEASDAPSIEPTFGYQYAFTKPDDWVRTVGMYADANRTSPLTDYSDEQAYWYANVTPIYAGYVSNDAEYGMDVAKWPQSFASYVEAHLAGRIVMRFATGAGKQLSSATLAGFAQVEKLRQREAKSDDAMNQPPGFPPVGKWVSSRSGGGSSLNGTTRGLR